MLRDQGHPRATPLPSIAHMHTSFVYAHLSLSLLSCAVQAKSDPEKDQYYVKELAGKGAWKVPMHTQLERSLPGTRPASVKPFAVCR